MSSQHNASAKRSSGLPPSASSPPNNEFIRFVTAESLGALPSEQKGFISSVRILESNANLTGIQLKRLVAEMFPPAALFGKDICDFPGVQIGLRDVVDFHGTNLQQH